MKKLWVAIVKLFGWKYDIPDLSQRTELQHCVMVNAPHTSIYDFLLGASCVWAMGLESRIFIKKEFFVFPIRWFLRRCGAVSVDRGNRSNNLVSTAVQHLNDYERLVVIITPEGTRKRVTRWKRGFYEIAVGAGVPVVITYIDYGKRRMGVGPTLMPTGDFNADMRQILAFYDDVKPRNAAGWDIAALKATYAPRNNDSTIINDTHHE